MVTCSGSVLPPPSSPLPSSMFGNFLNLAYLDRCNWPRGMVRCLVLMALIIRTHGLLHLVIWLLFILRDVLVRILLTVLVPGLLLSIGMLLILLLEMS